MPFTPTDYLPYDFANRRHIGPSPSEMEEMFKTIGVESLDELINQTVPESIRQKDALDFGKPMSERELLRHMRITSSKNKILTSLIGQGYYGTVTPPVIQRNILENPAWYTAYTPYQPEISQGRLEALLNFQTMISDLTGLEIANASLLDEATASIDSLTEQKIQNSLKHLFKNKTVMVIAHRLSTIKEASKIIVLNKGQVLESGTHQDLINKKGMYYHFYSLQQSE